MHGAGRRKLHAFPNYLDPFWNFFLFSVTDASIFLFSVTDASNLRTFQFSAQDAQWSPSMSHLWEQDSTEGGWDVRARALTCVALGRWVAFGPSEDERLGTRWCTERAAESCMHSQIISTLFGIFFFFLLQTRAFFFFLLQTRATCAPSNSVLKTLNGAPQ